MLRQVDPHADSGRLPASLGSQSLCLLSCCNPKPSGLVRRHAGDADPPPDGHDAPHPPGRSGPPPHPFSHLPWHSSSSTRFWLAVMTRPGPARPAGTLKSCQKAAIGYNTEVLKALPPSAQVRMTSSRFYVMSHFESAAVTSDLCRPRDTHILIPRICPLPLPPASHAALIRRRPNLPASESNNASAPSRTSWPWSFRRRSFRAAYGERRCGQKQPVEVDEAFLEGRHARQPVAVWAPLT